jgi:dTDP-4-dehydrorhamnose 3,5-epimerase
MAMPNTWAENEIRQVAESGGLRLAIKRNGVRSQGALIAGPGSAKLIQGVQLEALTVHPDDRGYFEEVFRVGRGLATALASAKELQVSAALSYAGTIKALHFHMRQTDLWTPATGLLQVVLYDLRVDSPTFGQTNTIYSGVLKPLQILIPPGVGHGYKVVGADPALLVYATDRFYDPSDEGRIAWNDPDINYDWETQKK